MHPTDAVILRQKFLIWVQLAPGFGAVMGGQRSLHRSYGSPENALQTLMCLCILLRRGSEVPWILKDIWVPKNVRTTTVSYVCDHVRIDMFFNIFYSSNDVFCNGLTCVSSPHIKELNLLLFTYIFRQGNTQFCVRLEHTSCKPLISQALCQPGHAQRISLWSLSQWGHRERRVLWTRHVQKWPQDSGEGAATSAGEGRTGKLFSWDGQRAVNDISMAQESVVDIISC